MVCTFNILSICMFLFLWAFWFFLDSVVLFLPSFVVFSFSLLAWHFFQYQISSLYRHYISSLLVLGFPILFHFWQTVWCCPCTLGGWFFDVIYEVYIHQWIPKICDWMASSLLQKVMVIAHLSGRFLSGFSPVKLSPLAVSFTLQFFIVFSINSMIFFSSRFVLENVLINI